MAQEAKIIKEATMKKSYYAEQSPRGFANEIIVHHFSSRAARDAWVYQHKDDGDCNSAVIGARACTAKRAQEILGYKGNAITESFNGLIEHEEAKMELTAKLLNEKLREIIYNGHPARGTIPRKNTSPTTKSGKSENGIDTERYLRRR
jgi:hypothetical protein